MLEGYVEVYLPDYKYAESNLAEKYSRAEDYPETAAAAIAEMVRQTGAAVFDEEGMMKRGVIVRHLLLPSHRKEAEQVVKYVYDTY